MNEGKGTIKAHVVAFNADEYCDLLVAIHSGEEGPGMPREAGNQRKGRG